MGNQALSSEPTAAGNAADDDTSTSEIVATEVSGSHVVTIDGYSWTKRVGRNEYIASSSFTAAGHRWTLRYYPNGCSTLYATDASNYISIFLSCDTQVDARCTFSLVDKDGKPTHVRDKGNDKTYVRTATNYNRLGVREFIKRDALELGGHVRGDRFRIRCDITVLDLVVQREDAAVAKFVDVPPSDILQDVGYLLSSGDGADVMFEVDGESFSAHRSILAARSPVFKAELFSPMKEGTATCVWVEDMDPRVFKALLHFVYNDEMPEIDESETMAMAQRLLVAADRYCLERLKLICEDKLCGYIDTSSVGTILGLAERHGCHGLKKACFSFLMSDGNLMAAIVSGGLEHMLSSYPSVVKEYLMKRCS